jgi:adenosyl cobinamide kinase/adenosyl cobinamide phosphate guanylyltransferase
MARNLSLRPTNQPSTSDPVWTHTKNSHVNHELDALHALWDTAYDTTPGFTDQQKLEAMTSFIRKRAATIRIGAQLGWSKVPESELLRDFRDLDVDGLAAQQIISTGPQRHTTTRSSNPASRGGSSRGRRSGRSRATSRPA